MHAKTFAIAALAIGVAAPVGVAATATAAEAAPATVRVADQTINHNGHRERVVVTRDAKGYHVNAKRVTGKAPAKMRACEFEDASGDADRYGCTYRGTTVALDYALRLTGRTPDAAHATILYVELDGKWSVGGW